MMYTALSCFWKAIWKLAVNQDHHSVGEMQAKIDKYVCKNDFKVKSPQKC